MNEPVDTPSWHLLPMFSARARVLYVGGRGAVAGRQLALSFGPVLVLEPTLDRARATRGRCHDLSVEGVDVVHGSTLDLPLQADSLDLAVLEAGSTELERSLGGPRLLSAVRTVLKPRGQVYIGIDPIRSGPGRLWQRFAALRSLQRYRRVLAATGFTRVRVWGAYPDSRDPKFLVEWTPATLDYFLRVFGRGLRTATSRLLNRTGMVAYGAPAYAVLASREPALTT